MSDPFLGEIRLFAAKFAPRNWALCNGQILQVNQNAALFSLLGNRYGGDGKTTFALPDLRGRMAVCSVTSGGAVQVGGAETVALTEQNMPAHYHMGYATNEIGSTANPAGAVYAARPAPQQLYGGTSAAVPLNSQAVTTVGSSQPHNNVQPSLVLNFIICTAGYYPSRQN